MDVTTCNPLAVVRTVLHVDMDAFYASIEQRDDPSLRGRPLLVGGDARRGVVLTASYEARPFGVRSAMPMARALRLCPRAVVRSPRMSHYASVSAQLMRILARFSPTVEPISLDEAFLDVTGEERLLGTGGEIARAIQRAVRDALALGCSVGVASGKFVAKVASDHRKPNGVTIVPPGEEAVFLAPLPVGRLYGVGRKTEARLQAAGFRTVADVAGAPERLLADVVGSRGAAGLRALALGRDGRVVVGDRAAVSIGSEETLAADTADRALLGARLLPHADQVAARLRASGRRARVVVLKLKDAGFTLRTRRVTLREATADAGEIVTAARALLARVELPRGRLIRLVGVAVSGLSNESAPRQLALPTETAVAPGDALARAVDAIHERFGERALQRGSSVGERER
jgi:DNA polymerase-4